MPALTARGYPYPLEGEAPDVPRDIKALADKANELTDGLYTNEINPASYLDTTASRGKLVRRSANGQVNVPATPDSAGAATSREYVDRHGLIASASINTDIGPNTILTAVPGLNELNFTVVGERHILLVFDGSVTASEAGTATGVRIQVLGHKFVEREMPIVTAFLGHPMHIETRYRLSGGNYIASVAMGRYSQTAGGAYITAREASLSVVDEGPV